MAFQVSGDLSIASSSLEAFSHMCEDKVLRNPKLYEEDENGNMVPPTKLLGAICPEDCSDHGKCNKGKCSCESGFGALDCSIDLNKPPTVNYLQEDGLCDLDKRRCKKVRAYGSGFLDSEKLTCHFQPIRVMELYLQTCWHAIHSFIHSSIYRGYHLCINNQIETKL